MLHPFQPKAPIPTDFTSHTDKDKQKTPTDDHLFQHRCSIPSNPKHLFPDLTSQSPRQRHADTHNRASPVWVSGATPRTLLHPSPVASLSESSHPETGKTNLTQKPFITLISCYVSTAGLTAATLVAIRKTR